MSSNAHFASDIKVVTLDADQVTARLDQFANMLHACVHDGASIGFIEPFPISEAVTFWRDKTIPALMGESAFCLPPLTVTGWLARCSLITTPCPIRSIAVISAN